MVSYVDPLSLRYVLAVSTVKYEAVQNWKKREFLLLGPSDAGVSTGEEVGTDLLS